VREAKDSHRRYDIHGHPPPRRPIAHVPFLLPRKFLILGIGKSLEARAIQFRKVDARLLWTGHDALNPLLHQRRTLQIHQVT
jgi:hypothetical protein